MNPSLYIHIPFCLAKCNYCSFNSYEGLEGLKGRYVEALGVECRKLASEGQRGPLQSVFFGGGTPTVLSNEQLRKIISNLYDAFEIEQDAEISIEANPGTVNQEKLVVLRACGINRLSIGVQSFCDTELVGIGRIHSAEEAKQAVRLAKKAGFSNLSLDLMYGLPQQTARSWRTSLSTALSMDVQHLSLYELTVEMDTPLQTMLTCGSVQLPDEEVVAEMDEVTADLSKRKGFVQYEISNYARKGFQCLHNINYWKNGEYYAIGAGAVTYLEGRRIKNIASPLGYCQLLESGQSVQVEAECLDKEASFRESVIMGLRMNRGVSCKRLKERYDIELDHFYGATLEKLMTRKLLAFEKGHLCLTKQGRAFANLVMAELV
jgi:oxygen-independent coproporphyrinogen-3 oxidase